MVWHLVGLHFAGANLGVVREAVSPRQSILGALRKLCAPRCGVILAALTPN